MAYGESSRIKPCQGIWNDFQGAARPSRGDEDPRQVRLERARGRIRLHGQEEARPGPRGPLRRDRGGQARRGGGRRRRGGSRQDRGREGAPRRRGAPRGGASTLPGGPGRRGGRPRRRGGRRARGRAHRARAHRRRGARGRAPRRPGFRFRLPLPLPARPDRRSGSGAEGEEGGGRPQAAGCRRRAPRPQGPRQPRRARRALRRPRPYPSFQRRPLGSRRRGLPQPGQGFRQGQEAQGLPRRGGPLHPYGPRGGGVQPREGSRRRSRSRRGGLSRVLRPS